MAEGIIGRVAKKLEQVLGVPRPWELTPATSMGYQMATGEGSLGERVRKGGAQFLGRYATNIKEPYGYDLPEVSPKVIGAIIRDQPIKLPAKSQRFAKQIEEDTIDRDVLYREMFDLPIRSEPRNMEKIGNKQYKLKDPNYGWAPLPYDIPNQPPTSDAYHRIMGGVYLNRTPEGAKYNDPWDIVSSDEKDKSSSPTAWARKLLFPLLRPASISGTVTVSGPTAP